ncbi:MAG TPA: hypothetical protein VNM48_00475 [Chloroflexota bacterium]|nr:hypothetical protein [Chloroflexota bacterium]
MYNLTVQGEHEFYANGILTHNCDAMRYLVATLDGVNQSEPGLIGTVDSLGRWVTR